MRKQMKPNRKYILVNIDEPYAAEVYEVLKRGQIARGEWPEGDISFAEWVERTWPRNHEDPTAFAAMARIREVTGARTQVQLAEVLDVRQSSISDAKRRAAIPDSWLVKLLRSHGVNPDWIMDGVEPKYLARS